MARRSDHSKEEIKELAINHAYKLIEEKGEMGFKARDIAKRMGYTVGTIYYIFGSMENLRFHVSAKILDLFYNIALTESSNKKNKLYFHITQFIKFSSSREYKNQWMFMYVFKGTSKEDVSDWYLEKAQRIFFLFVDALLPYTKSKKTAVKAAQTILASLHGMCILSISEKLSKFKKLDLEAMAKQLVKNYLIGLNSS